VQLVGKVIEGLLRPTESSRARICGDFRIFEECEKDSVTERIMLR
jgi:hypothetical protein